MSHANRRLVSTLLVGLCGAIAVGGFTDALDPLATAVDDAAGSVDVGFPSGRRDMRRLHRIADLLDKDSSSVKADIKTAGKVARVLDRKLSHYVGLAALCDDALDALEIAGIAARDGLAAWQGHLPGQNDEARLTRSLDDFDLAVERSRAAATRARRAKRLRGGCRRLDRVARRLDIDPDGDPPPAGALPSFALPDVNPSSATFGFEVSPRDFDGLISAWYFGHST